ncbi:MAG: FdhF/YdeP family oxidoreductase [Candidatus Obscuribacterales bacterium]
MRKTRFGGGFPAIFYTFSKALEVGPLRLWRKMRSRNACKTCAVGMGGQLGGMVNEERHFPEVCKKSLQAQVADMVGALPADYFERNSLEHLLRLTPKQAEDAGRLSYPVVLSADATHFKPIEWNSALDYIAAALKQTEPRRAAFYASGRSSNEAAFLLQSFARVYGTNNVMNCSFYCHQASGVALKMAVGSGTATVELEDLDRCDLVVLLGANPASNHPRLMTKLCELRERGGQVIVVNPLREPGLERFHVPSRVKSLLLGTPISSLYIQPLAGGDVALLVGVLKRLVELEAVDRDFLQAHCLGFDEVLSDAETVTWEEIVTGSGVTRDQIQLMAEMIAGSKAAIFAWAMGLTHHTSGVENVLAVTNIALATGNVGRPGAGLLPIRGHSNVQGVGTVGVTPALQDAVRLALEKIYGSRIDTEPGYDTFHLIEAAKAGKVDTLICLGGNLWGSNPDSQWAEAALAQIECIVYLSTKLNPGHFHGKGKTTIILPVLARDEEPQATTQESMFNFVRLSDGGEANVKGTMFAESQVMVELAHRVLGDTPFNWRDLSDHEKVRQLIAKTIPGLEEISTIGNTKKEFAIPGRVMHKGVFATADGRARLERTPLPKLEVPDDALLLITLRSEGQFNTIVYEEHDFYRGVPHRFCILVSSEDAARLKMNDGDRITVRGEAGSLPDIEVVIGGMRPGVVAMYYPEANVLIKGNIDPRSRTPAFKSAPVWLERISERLGHRLQQSKPTQAEV